MKEYYYIKLYFLIKKYIDTELFKLNKTGKILEISSITNNFH